MQAARMHLLLTKAEILERGDQIRALLKKGDLLATARLCAAASHLPKGLKRHLVAGIGISPSVFSRLCKIGLCNHLARFIGKVPNNVTALYHLCSATPETVERLIMEGKLHPRTKAKSIPALLTE